MDIILNFIKFSKYEWAAQCLEMSNTSGRRWANYRSGKLRECIIAGDFGNALQSSSSVGSWADSVQGHDYWEEIYDREFEL